MKKFDENTWFLFYIVCFLFIFNLSLTYKIPLFLQIFGLIVLCIVPGFLFCLLFSIKVIDPCENFLYSIGISIVFDLLFGLLINSLLPIFGVNDPLSSQNLQFSFSMVILLITMLIVYADKAPIISFKIPKILKIEKIFLIFGFLILVCSQIGIFLMNIENVNFFLIFSIFLIPILLFCLIIYYDDSIKRIYPFIIYLISFSLLMLLPLRSNYIIGIDSHEEYYFFYNTLIHSVWIPDPTYLLSAALSISIVPTVFENFLIIDPQILFKLLFPFLFSIIPVVVYVIAKKYVNDLLALFASCFFMFQPFFILTSGLSRTSLGIFFCAFAILVLCDEELKLGKKYILFILFISGTIFSHYTTALIFFLIILLGYLIDIVLRRYENQKEKSFVNLPIIIYFSCLLFFWYEQIINSVFTTGTGFAFYRFNIFNDFVRNDISKYNPTPIVNPSSLLKFINYSRMILFLLIGIGILFTYYNWVKKNIKGNSFIKYEVKINKNLLPFSLVAFGLLVFTFFAPFFFLGYDTSRVQELIFIVLPVFLIIGCNFFTLVIKENDVNFSKIKFHKKIKSLMRYCKYNKNKVISGILLFLLIPQLLFSTGVTDQFDGNPYSIILNSPKNNPDQLAFSYIFDQDARALQWYKINSFKTAQIFSDDYGNKKIVSQVNQQSTLYQPSLLEINDQYLIQGFIFSTVSNEYYNRFFGFQREEGQLSSFDYILFQKNKIFTNGAVLYK